MDRLICRDIDFGKAEVSVRAAFKGVALAGKQTMMLAPTSSSCST